MLLLNTILTVREGDPASHENFGWLEFTDAVLKVLNEQPAPIVFVTFGEFAEERVKAHLTPPHKHVFFKHPSPRTYTSFKGCQWGSKVNAADSSHQVVWKDLESHT